MLLRLPPVLASLLVALALSNPAPALADPLPGCWPRDLPLVGAFADPPPPAGPCAAASSEGAAVTSWRFAVPPARWISDMRRALEAHGFRLRGLRRVHDSAWDRQGSLSFTALRGDRPARGARFRDVSFYVRPAPGGATVVIHDYDLEQR